jgi:hypothetical protein
VKPPDLPSRQQRGVSFVVPEPQILVLSQDDSEPASVVVVDLADDEDEDTEADRLNAVPGSLSRYTGPSLLRPLRCNQRGILEALFTKCTHEPMHVVVSPSLCAGGSTQDILGRHYARLQNGALLEDEIINALMAWFRAEDAVICRSSSKRRSHFFSTYFFSRVVTSSGIDKAALDRWIRRVPGGSLAALEDVYVPIHINGIHWALLVISVGRKEARYHDSMCSKGSGRVYLDLAREIIRHSIPDSSSGWSYVSCTPRRNYREFSDSTTPQQVGGVDCGVFVCAFVYCIAHLQRRDFPFSQQNISDIRGRLALVLLEIGGRGQ